MINNETVKFNIRMNKELKQEAEDLLDELGMNLTTAFNVFLRQMVREGGIPFQISVNEPNKDTIEAMRESKEITKKIKEGKMETFKNPESLFEGLGI